MQLYTPTSEGRRGVVLKKKWGTPETRLTLRFLNNLGLHARCTEIILHCVSVSNQLQQWTNFCTNFSPKKWTRPPVEKSGGRRSRSSLPHYTRFAPTLPAGLCPPACPLGAQPQTFFCCPRPPARYSGPATEWWHALCSWLASWLVITAATSVQEATLIG